MSDIRKLNKVGKSVKRGKKLKIKTIERRYKPVEKPVETTVESNAADQYRRQCRSGRRSLHAGRLRSPCRES